MKKQLTWKKKVKMNNTPKYWKQYLDCLEDAYQEALTEWEKEGIKKVEQYRTRPWYQKIMQTEENVIEWHEWDKPYQPEKASVVGYYTWDVNIRKKKKNART